MAANLAATVTIQPGLSPVSPAFSKSFGDTRSLTPQGFAADSGVYLQISNSFCTERAGVDRPRRPQRQTGQGSPGFKRRRQRVSKGGVRDTHRSGIVAPAASVGVAGMRGTLRLGQRRGGSHPRVFPTPGPPKGGHIHTEMQGADSAVPTRKNRWEVRCKGGIWAGSARSSDSFRPSRVVSLGHGSDVRVSVSRQSAAARVASYEMPITAPVKIGS